MTGSPSYRPDIDGLRAIAVLSVVLFHLHAPGFGGGYVGVDIFFVISGYLITRLIEAERAQGTFSLKGFYLRRIRRLAPALVTVSLAASIGALVVLYPEDMRSFASSLALQFVTLQNVFFLADGEYFRGADTKPLLHTWTLAVEEQFYLFWPLVLITTARMRAAPRLVALGTLMTASFALNVALMPISPKASFFLLPPRAWEMGVGGLLALLERGQGLQARLTRGRRRTMSVLGLAAIVLAITSFSSNTVFPGFAAAVPVFGTALLIVSGIDGTTAISHVLAHPVNVRIGLLSYAVYLWHWPLIAFAHQLRVDPTRPLHAGTICVSTLALAELTYRYVETPVRQRRCLVTTKSLVAAFGAAALALAGVGIHSWTTDGAAYRYAPVARALLTAPLSARKDRCGIAFRALHPRAQVCALYESPTPARRVLLWGNSHADMWSGLFVELGAENEASVYLNARNCRPTLDNDFCGRRVQDAIFEFVASQRITDVVLASTWHGAYRIADEVFEQNLRQTVEELSARGVTTWLVFDTPAGPSLDPIVAFERSPHNPVFGSLPSAEYDRARERQAALFSSISHGHNGSVKLIDPSAALCDGTVCKGGDGDHAWYRDAEHLTEAGARLGRAAFSPVFATSEATRR